MRYLLLISLLLLGACEKVETYDIASGRRAGHVICTFEKFENGCFNVGYIDSFMRGWRDKLVVVDYQLDGSFNTYELKREADQLTVIIDSKNYNITSFNQRGTDAMVTCFVTLENGEEMDLFTINIGILVD